jgi:hypothetical protein
MAVLYHGSFVLARHYVVWLIERWGGFRFAPFCLLVFNHFRWFSLGYAVNFAVRMFLLSAQLRHIRASNGKAIRIFFVSLG